MLSGISYSDEVSSQVSAGISAQSSASMPSADDMTSISAADTIDMGDIIVSAASTAAAVFIV